MGLLDFWEMKSDGAVALSSYDAKGLRGNGTRENICLREVNKLHSTFKIIVVILI